MAPPGVAPEYRQTVGGLDLENLGSIAIETGGAAAHVLAHEFGHTVDLFAAPYFVDTGLGCLGMPGCAPSCQLDTTEEAPTLREAVAQLFAIAATSALYPVAMFEHCDPLLDISHGGDAAPHSDACRPNGEPYSHFLPVTCPPDTGFCDHDFDMGFEMGQPTGLCSSSNGYRTDSLHQAFWEIFHAQRCAPTPPYTCTPMSLPAGMSASDAFMPALLYALRVDAKSFRQFVDAFATHVSCNLDSDVYEEVNEVLCHHDLRECEALPPAVCRVCGNGVREIGETCDGNDLGGETCQSRGFDGGVLACDASCMLDTVMCQTTDTGLDATGASGTMDPGVEVTGADTSLVDEMSSTSAGSSEGGGGCECSTQAGRGTDVAVLGLGLFGLVAARRRRRARTGVAALATVLTASSMQGCCDPTVAMATSSMGESSTTSEGGATASTPSTGEPALPEWAIGVFSSESEHVGMSFTGNLHWWVRVEITAAGTFLLDWYSCSVHGGRQEFRWTSTDGGQSLTLQALPPNDVFTFGNGNQVSEVVVEPGDSCDTIVVRYFEVETMRWIPSELQRGNVCAKATGPDGCTFTFEWCDGMPPAPCE